MRQRQQFPWMWIFFAALAIFLIWGFLKTADVVQKTPYAQKQQRLEKLLQGQ